MEHDTQQDAPLATGSLAGSEEQLVRRAGAPGGSNKRALKVAGLTTLACLLLASQVFMAYTMFGQTKQIQKLQKNSEAMKLRLRAPPPGGKAPMKMSLPSLPLLMKLAEDPKTSPKKEEELEKEVVPQGVEVPTFNGSLLDNLQSMKEEMSDSDWKALQLAIHKWLIKHQAAAAATAQPGLIQTKCQMAGETRMLGNYKPQCDEQGRFLPMQCWSATGYCWCVDESGTVIEGTEMRGRPDCQRIRLYGARRRAVMAPHLMQKLSNDN